MTACKLWCMAIAGSLAALTSCGGPASPGVSVQTGKHEHHAGKQEHHAGKHDRRAGTPRVVQPGASIDIGQKAPDFTVVDLDGKSWKLAQLHQKAGLERPGIIVLTFWCSFCGSCRNIEQDLDALARQYAGEVAVFALDASAGETAHAVDEFRQSKGLTMPIVLDAEGVTPDIFGTELTTTTAVLDAEGVLRYCGQFADSEHDYAHDAVEDLLAGQEIRVTETPLRG